MGFFSKFKPKDRGDGTATSKSKKKHSETNGAVPAPQAKPHWEDAWTRNFVEPEEVQELLRGCTHELKSRALDMPFLLLPFRPASNPSAARTFIRNFFSIEKGSHLKGDRLEQELLLTEPMVLSSVLKWCWSRLAGGVVTWEAYELFRVGEQDSDMARDAFATFIPLSVESDARTKIIFDFFDLMAAIAAHGKTNGMGGRKLSRLAGWWAFGHSDNGNGFDGGYKSWSSAADATSHLFFAYLRSLTPDNIKGLNGITSLPLSLQALVKESKYPPENPPYDVTSKVVMVVDSVSPTPFALLRRAKHFEYRDDDLALQEFSDYKDPVDALTDECRRVLKSISATNQSTNSTTKDSTSLGDTSWSRFEDLGFGALAEEDEDEEQKSHLVSKRRGPQGMQAAPQTKTTDLGRPTTPSWADFLSSGFVDEPGSPAPRPLLLPPDKILPPIDVDSKRGKSSQSHKRNPKDSVLEPGELASINALYLDDAFWWVWITSLAGEETLERKAVFGRCALIETTIRGRTWLVIEEMIKGAAPEPEVGAYIAEKKSRFTFGKKSRVGRTKSMGRRTPQLNEPISRASAGSPMSKTSIGPDQHARIQAAAAALQQKQRQLELANPVSRFSPARGRQGDAISTKTNSVFTLQPVIVSEAAPAMKWASTYDKHAIRAKYLGTDFIGRPNGPDSIGLDELTNGSITPQPLRQAPKDEPKDYGFPKPEAPKANSQSASNRNLPALPAETPSEKYLQAPTSPPPPVPAAPLPAEPDRKAANHVAADAAEVPLPAMTPMESTEKHLPADGEPLGQVPTNTSQSIDGTPGSSPESRRRGNKLKKQPGSSGLKNIFGKKKAPPPDPSQPAASAAVAAARAAYQGPHMKPNYKAVNTPSLTRRLSGIGRKKMEPAAPQKEAPMPEETPVPAPSAPFKDNYGSQLSLNRVDSTEVQRANHEFKSFDQGPIDQPAFVPADDSRRPSFVPGSPTVSRPSTEEPPRGPHFDPPPGRGEYEPSAISSEEGGGTDSPALDRWAQIRKNAAERAGKVGEDKRTSQDKTEDGDESGEETIESRVARIKARVAELTGNMTPTEVKV